MVEPKDGQIPLINKKILGLALVVIAIGGVMIIIAMQSNNPSVNSMIGNTSSDSMRFIGMTEGKEKIITVPKKDLLFNITIAYDKNNNLQALRVEKLPELADFYKKVVFDKKSEDVVFVYPIFTQGAYGDYGFYDYYNKKCGPECLTIPIPQRFVPMYSASMSSTMVLSRLNYSSITDVDVDKNPEILKKYSKVIVLHNEYVTKKEFDAITSHPNVIYLFPNALYAEVSTNYTANTFTLIKGHGYPTSSIKNGFDWKFDNSNLEYNSECDNMTLYTVSNGKMLNCYPAYRSLFDKSFLEMIKNS